MTVDIHSEDGQIIRQLIPLATIPASQFEVLCQNISVESAKKNTFLFKRNDSTNELIYLIDGSVSLQSEQLSVETISSGTESSRFALAHQIPRKIDAFSNSTVRFLRLNIDTINNLPSPCYEEENSYMVTDETETEEDDDDWMSTLLKSPIFRALPPANLQKILIGLEEVAYEKGDVVIKQGDPGDFYYLIKKGQCMLSRKASANAKEIKLGLLRSQDTFGEDSLLSGEPRNVNITALTKSTLLRLSKDKFISLIKTPSLKYIPYSEINSEANKDFILLDVRAPDEYKAQHLPGSVNAPFFSLRMQLKIFDKKKPVIVICENGKTSEAAAFLLLRHKIGAFILKGGMDAVSIEDDQNKPTAEFSIDDGVETLFGDGIATDNDSEPASFEEIAVNADDLLSENKKLKETVKKLSAEKEDLEKKYRVLYKQSEKLKAVLDTLKIGGGSS